MSHVTRDKTGVSMRQQLLPDVVTNRDLYNLSPLATVQQAVQLMAEKSIGAVLVMEGSTLRGIFSERDLLTRVVALGRSVERTMLREVMTVDVVSVPGTITPEEALRLMRAHHCRHLPVVEDGLVVAMVSIRDIFSAVQSRLERDNQEKQAFIFSGGY